VAQTVNAVHLFTRTESFAKACYGELFHSHKLPKSMAENYCKMTWTEL